ncbi:hypothetical protein [Streptosporangium sp. CA-115845]
MTRVYLEIGPKKVFACSAEWPVRYAARRIAWHVIDHLWEMEDRRTW